MYCVCFFFYQTHLSFSFKAVKKLDNVWMLEIPHDLDFSLETAKLLFRAAHLRHEFQSHHLKEETHSETH